MLKKSMLTRLINPKKEKNFTLSIILAFFPLAFIAGNTLINLNLVIFLIVAFYFYKTAIFKLDYDNLDKLLILFFFFLLLSGVISDVNLNLNVSGIFSDINSFYDTKGISVFSGAFYTTSKSILFLRFLLFFIVIRFLIKSNNINFIYFFVSSFFLTLFVSLDIFYQFIFGKDIFGYVSLGRKLSGPFNDEAIAGGYLQRFSIFSFFTIFFFKNNICLRNYTIINFCILIVILPAIILAGNRMPLIMFLFSIFLILILLKDFRKQLLPLCIIIGIVFSIILNFSQTANKNFENFQGQIKSMTTFVFSKQKNLNNAPGYIKEFSTFYHTWLMNKYLGGGIKMFRYNCHKRPNIEKDFSIRKNANQKKRMKCNMHPHNYYLEILTETGIIGFAILSIIFFFLIYKILFKFNLYNSALNKNFQFAPFLILLMIEIFPIKSTGSFFTTGNATYFFLILSISMGILRKYNLIENKP